MLKENNNFHSNNPIRINRLYRKRYNTYYHSKQIIGVIFILLTVLSFYGFGRVSLAHYYASSIPNETNFKKATQLNPLFDVYKRNLSILYMNMMLGYKDSDKRKFQEYFLLSKQEAERALNISPLDIRNVRQLLLTRYYAGVNLDKKYQRENIPLAKKLVSMSSTDYRSWDFLGLVYLDITDLTNAQLAFEKELTLKNDLPGVYLHLGEVAKQEGEIDTAIDYYKKAVSLSPGWDFSRKELEKILAIKEATNSAKKP